jgi:hypothetical protein
VVTRAPRTSQFPAPCTTCGLEVPAGTGVLTWSRTARKHFVRHKAPYWVGVPCAGEAIGQPGMGRFVGGCPEPEQLTESTKATA